MTLLPVATLARFWQPEGLQRFVSGQPLWLQFLAIIFVADFSQYWIHRAFHRVPWLWRVHAVHHSSRVMDWMAGSRLHLFDVIAPRGHHWHHAVEPVDVNFAVHLPFLDRLFGTQHLPGDRWPPEYGIAKHPVPEGWGAHLLYPFRQRQ